VDNETLTCELLSKRYKISRTRLSNWYKNYSNGVLLYSTSGERGTVLDTIASAALKVKTVEADKLNRAPTVDEYNALVLQGRIETARRRQAQGGRPVTEVDLKMPCKATLDKVKEEVNVGKRKGQHLTEARRRACADPRMSYSWYLTLEACSADLCAEYKWNFDGTTFKVHKDGNGQYHCVYVDERDNGRVQVVDNDSSGSELPIYIKWMAMTNAAGEMSPLVLIVAIEDLDEEDFAVHTVTGLTSSAKVGDFGYLAFCKSRAGNKSLWTWYFKQIVVATIAHAKSVNNIKVTKKKYNSI
jgi:hypothetical protein